MSKYGYYGHRNSKQTSAIPTQKNLKPRTQIKHTLHKNTMFGKLRNKFSNQDDLRVDDISRRTSSGYNQDGAANLPKYASERPSADGSTPPSYRSRSISTSNRGRSRALSSPGDAGRQQDGRSTPTSSSTPRKRHFFWRTSLWNSKHHGQPSGSRVRAQSQSVTLPHPSVAEEQMRNMPHHDWQGKNRPDRTYDEANLARLYS